MLVGIPIIHSGLLHNPETKTYGIPDLLVRSDWINGICKIDSLDDKEIYIPAPKLRDIGSENISSPKYHYLAMDIKFTTLSLRSDGIHLLNCGSIPAYKSQLYIYNEALALIQGYNPQKAFILGRKWKFTSKGETYKGRRCFDRLGKIDYRGVDIDVNKKTEDAIKWLREVRSEASKSWNIDDIPLLRSELYPNMSNTYDYPWHETKEQISNNIKELTSLWMVGTKHREIAHNHGVFKWTDKKCTPKKLGICGKFTSRVLSKILEVNRGDSSKTEKVLPSIINNNLKGWQQRKELEFYVDFETINDVLTDFESLPEVEETSLIFMIGVGYKEPVSGRWMYKCFCVNSLTLEEEGRICQEFSDYICSESALYDVEDPLCVHWAHAEENFWNDAVERHESWGTSFSRGWQSQKWEWFDLLKVFKEEPVVVRGSLGFSLKQISNALRDNDCISSEWDLGSSCLNGRGAMVGAWKAHKESLLRKIDMSTTPQIKEIMKYNEVDVKVLQEIITYLRNNHTKYGIRLEDENDEGENELPKLRKVIPYTPPQTRKRKRDESMTNNIIPVEKINPPRRKSRRITSKKTKEISVK